MIRRIIYILLFLPFAVACSHEPMAGPDIEPPVPPGSCDPPGKIYYANHIQPMLTSHCAIPGCHDAQTPAVRIDLSTYEGVMSSMVQGEPIVVPGMPMQSKLYRATRALDLVPMPPLYNFPMSNARKELIRQWILQGATNEICTEVCPEPAEVSWRTHIKPLVDEYCAGCHYGNYAYGDIELRFHFQVAAIALNDTLYGVLTGAPGYKMMPIDVPMPQCKVDLVKRWIDAGAPNN